MTKKIKYSIKGQGATEISRMMKHFSSAVSDATGDEVHIKVMNDVSKLLLTVGKVNLTYNMESRPATFMDLLTEAYECIKEFYNPFPADE